VTSLAGGVATLSFDFKPTHQIVLGEKELIDVMAMQ